MDAQTFRRRLIVGVLAVASLLVAFDLITGAQWLALVGSLLA